MFQLPNPQQVKNIAGHAATAVATAIALLGLQAKGLDPAKITVAINALGDLVNNLIIVGAAVGSAYAAWKSVTGSSTNEVTKQSAQAIISDPGAVAASLPAETKTELAQATVAMAENSETTKNALTEAATASPLIPLTKTN
jgi:hypothetical protein